MAKKTFLLLITFALAVTLPLYFVRAFTTSSAGYANNGAPQTDAYAGTSNILIMDISLPDPVSDADIGGTAPSAGTQITDTKDADWTTMSFYDQSGGDAFNSSNDWIGLDDDQDGVYTSGADAPVDCDGSTTNGQGTCDSHNAGDALTATAASDNLCADSLTSPSNVYIDGDGDCTWGSGGTDTAILGDCSGGACTNAVGTSWAYVDANTNTVYDDGEDLYIENVSGELTYSASADTTIAGTTPSVGTALTATEPTDWNLYYYDKTDSDAWDNANDWIGLDNDSSGYYNGDKISSVKVENLENALDDDISAIKIWQEDDTTAGFQTSEDTLIGSDASGAKWGQTISTGSAVVYTASTKDRIYITVDIASGAINGRIVQAKIPVNGLQFASTNDGPSDVQIVNPYTQTIISGTTGSAVDNTAPTSSITDPLDGATINAGVDYTIQGTCSDEGGSSVMQVEISFDGGQTWHLTTPLQSTGSGFAWSYLWEGPEEGTYNIKTRATDWMGNTETPGDGITVTVSSAEEEEEVEEEQPAEEEAAEEETSEEETPTEEKPITEMTAEELEAKILEIQQQIIQLLQQLIEMVQQQILELGGTV